MKNVLTVIFLFSSIIYSSEYPNFTQKEMLYIEKSNPISSNRIKDYNHTLKILQQLKKEQQLTKINLYLNGLLSQYDQVVNKKENFWATPKEFLMVGYGDCEDYAIIKYYTLVKLHFPEKQLFLTIVKEKFHGGYHMVLSYFDQPNKSPLILDNLSFKILRLSKRVDLEAKLFINTLGVFAIDSQNRLHKVAKQYKDFVQLENKIIKNL